MIDEFFVWFKANEQRLRSSSTSARVKHSELRDESLFADSTLHKANVSLKTEDILASFTVWNDGALEIIIMNNHTGEEIVVDDRKLLTPNEMPPILDHYCNLISSGSFLKQP